MKITNGKYITFLDCDDLHLPEKIAIQLEVMKKNDTVLSYGSWIEINAAGSEIKKHKIKSQNSNVFEQLLYKYNVNFQTLMIDKNFIESSNICFDTKLVFSPDFMLVMQIAYSNNISSIGDYLAQYRVHSDSMSHQYQEEKYNDKECMAHRRQFYHPNDEKCLPANHPIQSHLNWVNWYQYIPLINCWRYICGFLHHPNHPSPLYHHHNI